MRKNSIFFILLIIAGVSLFFSCATSQAIPVSRSRTPVEPKKPTLLPNQPPQGNSPAESAGAGRTASSSGRATAALPERVTPSGAAPERMENPSVKWPLLGKGRLEAEKLAAFLLKVNAEADPEFVNQLSELYITEAALEGIDHDVAFSQMCLETGFLRYGGLVTPEMNNFCGLGAIGPEQPGERFPTPQLGVRAQIQHLKGYATEEPLAQDLVDPRYKYVRYGSAPTIEGLAGTWAADRSYADKIVSVLQRLYNNAAGLARKAGSAATATTAAADPAQPNS
ncbi:cell wall hydrolase/autolysin [Treponema primitia ZAS-2]|uniref:Cell wall hydrolase/autolysin n=1 Tax=Treponema primitia (strain ATCC BAA-887 / DSM 12427 / ZAS-2) TaxID=545694 RepID=F5YKS1_TREPZ|nr:glucosaminidase domain-containing protein [Treponema primitia]AEF84930.1 cell wall hydrolase/autolysin [Treponema primitia ZAS-2]